MEEWKEYKLGEIGTVVGGATPSTKDPMNYDGDISWITPKDLSGYESMYIDRGERMITQQGYNSCSCKMLPKGSVLFSSRAPIGYVAIAANDLCTNQGFKSVIPNNKIVNNIFLYYLLAYNKNFIEGLGSGTTFKEVSGQTMKNIVVKIPSLSTQHQISSILKSLDDKIEVNRKINENLEQQAQALFKSWFVDFEPFKNGEFVESELGMIPKGWRVGTLGEYCKVRSGFAFKSTWWTNEGVPVIKIKNITDNGNLEMLDCSFVSKEHAALAKEFQTKEGDLLIAMTGATIGKFCIVHDNSKYCVNQRVGKFFLGNEPLKKLPFIFLNLKQSSVHDEIINRGQGSAQPNISGGDIETLKVVIAPDVVISNFNVMLYPSFKKMISNQQESRRLAELRETLLPKLMSGELKVNEVAA